MAAKLHSAVSKLFSGSVLRAANLIVAAGCSFFLMPFIVHHLGDRLYGFWTFAATFVGYYGLLDFGFSMAVSQYMSVAIGKNDPRECRSIFNSALRIQTLLGCLILLVTVATAAASPWFSRTPEDAAVFWKVIAILGTNLAIGFPPRAYAGILEAELRFDIQSALGMFGILLRTVLTVCALSAGGGLLAVAWATLLATLPVIALQIFFAKREAPWARIQRSSIDPAIAKKFFSYSIYMFLTAIADLLRFQVDSLVIAGLIGLAAVTHYRIASVFTRYYMDIVVCAAGMILPLLGRLHGAQDRGSLEKVFFFATRVSVSISVFVCLSLICWGPPFVSRWMGPNYQDAYWPLVILAISALLDVGQNPSISLLYATFKHRFYTYMNCAEGIMNLGISLALARPFGVLGVALGTLIAAFVIRVIVQPLWVCKVSGLDYGAYMAFLGRLLLRCCVLAAGTVVLVAWGIRPDYSWLVGSAICATVIYAVGSWFVIFGQPERQQLLAIVKRRQNFSGVELAPTEAAIL